MYNFDLFLLLCYNNKNIDLWLITMKKFTFDNINSVLQEIPVDIKQKKVSILLPYYNEASIIVQNTHLIISQLLAWDWNFEIIVSDDGSYDNGTELLNQEFTQNPNVKIIRSSRNYGKGRALCTAFEKSVGEYILFIDSDLELSIDHLPYFMDKMIKTNSDIVIGSKEDPRSDLNYPFIRKLFSRVYALINKILFNLSVKDTQTGIKLFKREVLEDTLPYLLVKRFAFDIELLALCQYRGYTIESHPIILHYTRGTELGRMNLDAILSMFKDTIAVFWRLKSNFWKNIALGKKNLKYAILSFDEKDKDIKDMFYINTVEDVPTLLSDLKSYDIIIFKEIGDEIPIFAQDILDRIFIDPTIKGILPLLYPITKNIYEELYYSVIGNMFFPKGYYPRYRPVKQGFISNLKEDNDLFSTTLFVYRRELLEEIIAQNDNKFPIKIQNITSVVHTPSYFIHKQFPNNRKEFQKFIRNQSDDIVGIKKNIQTMYLFLMVLFIVALVSKEYLLILPLMLVETGMYLWYIYSLGIRKGIRYIILFNIVRITRVRDTSVSLIKYIMKIIINKK